MKIIKIAALLVSFSSPAFAIGNASAGFSGLGTGSVGGWGNTPWNSGVTVSSRDVWSRMSDGGRARANRNGMGPAASQAAAATSAAASRAASARAAADRATVTQSRNPQ